MEFQDVNVRVCQMIKSELTDISYSTWVKYLEKAYMERNNIIIKVPDSFVQEIVKCRYIPLYHSAYSHFRDEFKYNEILVEVDENLAPDEENKNDIDKEEDSSMEYNIKTYTAKEMRLVADHKSSEPIDVEKVAMEELNEIYDVIKFCASMGKYEYIRITEYSKDNIIMQKVTRHLIDNGYKVETKQHNEGKAVLKIEW